MQKKRILFTGIFTLLFVITGYTQQIRLDNLKEQYNKDNLVKLNGGVSANTVFYNGNNAARDPFTWVLSGNVNFSFFNQFNLPFSFNFNNLGGNYTYPTMPNRLSVHPTYKWIAGHIGDVSMSFSPYTLNGHQFTGVGVDLTPSDFPLSVSIMYGRMLKATEFNAEERLSAPAYKRMGYGTKIQYEKEKYSLSMNFFGGKDDNRSLEAIPDSLEIFPKTNVAMSWEIGLKLIKNLTLTAEYGLSLMNRDNRIPEDDGFFDKLFSRNISSKTYHAVRGNLSYQLKKNTFGFGYERIDPEYQTLGAYYFTNDLENYTFNFARPFFQDKLTLALNAGFQHDNLDNNKSEEATRFVGAFNLNYNHNERLNASFSYSNFQTYTNIKSQFDYINEMTNYDNLDTLNFSQLSQNANMNVNWNFGNEAKKHNFSFNLNYQESADKQDGTVRTGGASQFYNFATNYGIFFVPQNIQLTSSVNVSYNTIGTNDMLTYGPSLGLTTRFFNKKLMTGASASYNISTDEGNWQNSIINLRLNAAYQFWKKHSLNFVLINQSRNMKARLTTNDFTGTFTYSYNF